MAESLAIRQSKTILRFFEIAFVFVCLDHVASVIVNANHGIMRPAVEFGVVDCIAEFVWLVIPQPTKWQRSGDEIKAAFIFARSNFVNVLRLITFQWILLSP
jgi:hypothetical protein